MSWITSLIQVFKIPDLRKKVLFVLGIFMVFRVMANIPVAAIDREVLQDFFGRFQILGLMNVFTGGAMDTFSIIMLGLGPFITATIVMQLLTMIFPALNRLYKEEGETGRKKFNQYGRLLAVPFAIVQGYGFLSFLKGGGVVGFLTPFDTFMAIVMITAGTILLMWLGELITEQGIGNGVSLLIFAGIVAAFPSQIGQMIAQAQTSPDLIPNIVLFFAMAIIIIAAVSFFTEAKRNIPVSYAKRVRGNKMYGGVSTYLPLSMNPAGVIPIIFALSLLTFPAMIAQFLGAKEGTLGVIARFIGGSLENLWIYGGLLFILVVAFTYFYTAVTFDPKSIASNLQKMGGFIPGVRPGATTAEFLMKILNRILLVGATFLGLIAVMPSIVQMFTRVETFEFLVGGTATLIMVSVALETMRQIRSQLQMREYET
ncbi:MAG: preprotein translocase subunit SecY, partial [bacterium]|nr:preprotein translocase subunit SecY [bacterium]